SNTDPIEWLNRIVTRVSGSNLKLQNPEVLDDPCGILCTSIDNSVKVIFSTQSIADIQHIKSRKRNLLLKFKGDNPFFSLPKHVKIYEVSSLNGGDFFDLEMAYAWKKLTAQNMEDINRLWIYEF